MPSNSAAYMRAYRARKKLDPVGRAHEPDLEAADRRIAELEEEIAHLKRQLATAERFNTRPFTPVPKSGR